MIGKADIAARVTTGHGSRIENRARGATRPIRKRSGDGLRVDHPNAYAHPSRCKAAGGEKWMKNNVTFSNTYAKPRFHYMEQQSDAEASANKTG